MDGHTAQHRVHFLRVAETPPPRATGSGPGRSPRAGSAFS